MMHSFSTSEFVYVVQLSVKQRSDASLSMLYEQRRRSVMPDVYVTASLNAAYRSSCSCSSKICN